ncbi:MAG: Type 1 glutamine amidotransferase-like domain-containing protein [Bacillota bacterium]
MINILLSQYNFHEEWIKDTILKYISSNDKVVVIPFAFSERWISNNDEWQNAYSRSFGKYYGEIVDPFVQLGISEDNIIWLNYFEHSEEEMKSIIENSDIAFLTGGLPEMAVLRVLEKGLANSIAGRRIVMGASAGALMQLENYHVSPDEDYTEFMYFPGLGLIKKDFYIEVHYEDTNIQNKCIKRVLKEKTDLVYGIKDNGAIIIEDGTILLLGDVITFNSK